MKKRRWPMKTPCIASDAEWPPKYRDVWAWRQQQLKRMREDPKLAYGAYHYYKKNKVKEFIAHWVDTYDPRNAGTGKPTHMPFVPFDRQGELIDFVMAMIIDEEDGMIEKCRDAGVTWMCVGISIYLWLFWPGVAIGWGSRKEQLVDKLGDPDSIFEKLRMAIKSLPPEFLPVGFDAKRDLTFMRIVNPETQATITGEVGDDIGRGGRKRVYFKDESAHYRRAESIEASLGDNTNCQIDISSVNGVGNVFYRKRQASQVWEGVTHAGDVNAFILRWQDHPAKTQSWYDERKRKAEKQGLLHLFAQEVDRSYTASVIGTVIPADWIESAMDAHEKLGIEITGPWHTGLDVADNARALDCNAQVFRRGILLAGAYEWHDRDTGVVAKKAISNCDELEGDIIFEYDPIGVGSGVKAEINRLGDEDKLDPRITFDQWWASGSPQFPEQNVEEGDEDSPLNKDFYQNLKAQGGWQLRRRFERTHKAITEGKKYDPDTLISISSRIPAETLANLKKELAQPTVSSSVSTSKLLINKTPDGTKSPNLYDASVSAFWPILDKDETNAAVF